MRRRRGPCLIAAAMATAAAITIMGPAASPAAAQQAPECDPDNGGLSLPPGFCAIVVADQVGPARHLTVAPNGDIFVALRNRRGERGAILALRDTNGDGRADQQARFGENGGTGITLHEGFLYFAPDDAVLRYPLTTGSLQPAGPPDTIVAGLPANRGHTAKSIAIGADDALFVNIGSLSNACQVEDRRVQSPGMEPCTELETRAGIWKFDAKRKRQTQADGERFATGLRNIVALAVDPTDNQVYGVQHGRDQLSSNWPDLFSPEANADLPSEEFVRIERGTDFGWPYCYHDWKQGKKVLAPEYGGDGRKVGRCSTAGEPIMAFPGHWAPNALLFYTGSQFPEEYRGGAFIAFHGSWNRAPLPQAGYNVVFVPFKDGRPTGDYTVFADGFAGATVQPAGAAHRPSGLALGPDSSLYVSDDSGGRIWRIVFVGTDRR